MSKENNAKNIIRKNLYLNTNMSITDNTEIVLENCKKILEYNDIYIKISTSTITFQIWGKELEITDFEGKGLIIKGKFSSIEFL